MTSSFSIRRIGGVALIGTLLLVQGSVPAEQRTASARQFSLAASPVQFAQPAFETTWRHTDAPVASSIVKRTWFWGPSPNSAGLTEEYIQGIGGKRLVQYFDKSRME